LYKQVNKYCKAELFVQAGITNIVKQNCLYKQVNKYCKAELFVQAG